MLGMAYSIGVLLALASATVMQGCGECQSPCSGTAGRPVTLQGDDWMTHRAPSDLPSVTERCQATATHNHLVQELLHRMEKSVKFDKPPNPSILLAMNLAGATHGHVHRWLLHKIKKDAVERAQTGMTSGEVALYVLALLSSCKNPLCVHAMGKTINLIPILKQKMNEEISKNGTQGHERRTGECHPCCTPSAHPSLPCNDHLCTESLDILALCLVKEYDNQDAVKTVAKELLNVKSSFTVESRAMAVLALVCAYNHSSKQHLIHDAVKVVTNNFLDEQERRNGMIGNICSMGLALQALEISSEFYAPRKWDRAQAFSVVYSHDYKEPMAMAQVLPPLVGKSYLNAAPITVQFSITNTLKTYFHYSTSVCVPDNSTLLQVMEVARNEKPDIFCFETISTNLGPFVTSIHGLAGNTTERTYWQFLSSWSPLQKGVGTYKPKNWEHIQAVFSTY